MEQVKGREKIVIFNRIISYTNKQFKLLEKLDAITDSRVFERVPTWKVLRSAAMMTLANLGSLNALEQAMGTAGYRKWVPGEAPSADTIGRVMALISSDAFREINRHIYQRLIISKAPRRTIHGFLTLTLDGHESHRTSLRHCEGCMERKVQTVEGEKTEYYHRHVLATLPFKKFCFLLDAEAQKPGEGEVAAAARLLERLRKEYTRAFDIVLVDSLYAGAPFLNQVTEAGKHFVVVLKKEKLHAVRDARALLEFSPKTEIEVKKTKRIIRGVEGIQSWRNLKAPLRVLQSLESTTVRRQITKKDEEIRREWMFGTDLPSSLVSDVGIVTAGHERWDIENQGFNETVNGRYADHVYKHESTAMMNFYLLTLLAYNLFHIFLFRNLSPILRARYSKQRIMKMISSPFFDVVPGGVPP